MKYLPAAALLLGSLLHGGPVDLIPTADGGAIFFRLKTGIVTNSWFQLVREQPAESDDAPVGSYRIQRLPFQGAVDTDDTGVVIASSTYASGKQCGTAGSTCSLAPSCTGSFSIGPFNNRYVGGGQYSSTIVRLSPSGEIAWIAQGFPCFGGGAGRLVPGLYDARTLSPLASSGISVPSGATLANNNAG